jgi:hypothetical protein
MDCVMRLNVFVAISLTALSVLGVQAVAAAPLEGTTAATRVRALAEADCDSRQAPGQRCFKSRVARCERITPTRINCLANLYIRPGEAGAGTVSVCRFWAYVYLSGRAVRTTGEWHFECSDRNTTE